MVNSKHSRSPNAQASLEALINTAIAALAMALSIRHGWRRYHSCIGGHAPALRQVHPGQDIRQRFDFKPVAIAPGSVRPP